jgi:hypothetical protein
LCLRWSGFSRNRLSCRASRGDLEAMLRFVSVVIPSQWMVSFTHHRLVR